MPTVELTDKFCQSARAVSGRKTDYFDTVVKGLALRVSTGGAKSWYAVYGPPAKRQWLKLGTYPETPLGSEKGARQKARDTRAKVGEGGDPAADRKAQAASQTAADLVDNYIARHASTKRSGDEIARRLRKNVKDVIGDVKLSVLHRRDITKCIDAVKDRGAHVEANRLFEDVRAMVRWARGRGDLDTNLVEGMRKPTETTERDRVLSADEIKTMWKALPDADMRESTRRILRLCLVTGQRVGEVAGMSRDEFDLTRGIWIIPAARAKNKREHMVPLSDMAIEIIAAQLADATALAERKDRQLPQFVFPAPGGRVAVSGASVPKAVKREEITKRGVPTIMGVEPWTPHDLRRTAATHMEEIGISPFVIGHVLNHVSATKASITSRVYARYDYGREKREALDLWADRLAAIVESRGHIVPLRKAVAQ
ncbi:tyrosine-type recombinase/integrase [Mesorhizobium onobrychidis]|uniref:Tyrosine-type recombinase/integrase n=1 Tax=Mesorhizobium onobrychidis TaxID=2775404 RepID=A0ABY5QQ31_9HYPH|nr:site-specific integrase [Mesorhizobium onobrychidis]UVC12836.1 tyrosine-type recombinase/integrase [Mesorhizobium onobrychidis]